MVEAVETFPEIHVENLPDLSKYQLELATDILVVKPADVTVARHCCMFKLTEQYMILAAMAGKATSFSRHQNRFAAWK